MPNPLDYIPNLSYEYDCLLGSPIEKAVAAWVSTLMEAKLPNGESRLSTDQQGRLWSQMKHSVTLWGLLLKAIEQQVVSPRFVDTLQDDGEALNGVISLNPRIISSQGGVGSVSVILAHEIFHVVDPAGKPKLTEAYDQALSSTATRENVGAILCSNEAEAFYVANKVRLEVIGYTPDIQAIDFPALVQVALPDGLTTTKAVAIASITEQLLQPGKFVYSEEATAMWLAGKVRLPALLGKNQAVLKSFKYTAEGTGTLLEWTSPDGKTKFNRSLIVEPGGSYLGALKCDLAGGLSLESDGLVCNTALSTAALSLGPNDGSPLVRFISQSATSLTGWISEMLDYTVDDQHDAGVNPELAYYLSSGRASKVSFGDGIFQTDVFLAPGADVMLDSSIGTQPVTISRTGDKLRITGSAGQFIDVDNWQGATLSRANGESNLLSTLLGDSTRVMIGSAGTDTLYSGIDGTAYRGGKGDDLLLGTAANNRFEWGGGDGIDTIYTPSDSDVLAITNVEGLTQMTASRAGNDLLVSAQGQGDGGVLLKNWFLGYGQMSISFADGLSWTPAQINAAFKPAEYGISFPSGTADVSDFKSIIRAQGYEFAVGDAYVSGVFGFDWLDYVWQSGVASATDTGKSVDGHAVRQWGSNLFAIDNAYSWTDPNHLKWSEFQYQFWQTDDGSYRFSLVSEAAGTGGQQIGSRDTDGDGWTDTNDYANKYYRVNQVWAPSAYLLTPAVEQVDLLAGPASSSAGRFSATTPVSNLLSQSTVVDGAANALDLLYAATPEPMLLPGFEELEPALLGRYVDPSMQPEAAAVQISFDAQGSSVLRLAGGFCSYYGGGFNEAPDGGSDVTNPVLAPQLPTYVPTAANEFRLIA